MRAVIFGADKLGVDFYFAVRANEKIICFIDNNVEKQGKEIFGIKILSADKLTEMIFDRVYIASEKYFNDIMAQMKELGIDQNKISLCPIQSCVKKKALECLNQFHETCKKQDYDNVWEKIREKYKHIKVHKLTVAAIGELLMRFFIIMNTCKDDKVLRIFIPEAKSIDTERVCNRYLVELLGRKIHIVQEDDVAFWMYIIKTYSEDMDFSEYDKYSSRNGYLAYKGILDGHNNWFNDAEIENGNNALEQMGIKEPFVCFAARTDTYNKKTIGQDFDYGYRNMKFSDYKMAIKYLQKQHITAVRMGRMETPMKKMNNCIDYAGLYADDFKDLFLSSRCKFMVASATGAIFMAGLFGKPVIMVNTVPVFFGMSGTLYTDKDLYIPKKYYDINRDRYLTLREMLKADMQCSIYGKRYAEKGIKFIDNTPEEIAAVVQEMIRKIDGTWQDDIDDQKNHERYLEIYQEMKRESRSNPDVWTGEPVPYRIATTYLRDNLYLLE